MITPEIDGNIVKVVKKEYKFGYSIPLPEEIKLDLKDIKIEGATISDENKALIQLFK